MVELRSRYPLSCSSGKVEIKLFEILKLYCKKGDKILDPTCGKKYIWGIKKKSCERKGFFIRERYLDYELVFSDSNSQEGNIVSKFQDLKYESFFDVIVFDPPYLFGYPNSKDKRAEDYGGYDGDYEELKEMIGDANVYFYKFLKSHGVLIFKCADMFHVKEKKFYPLHAVWINILSNFELVDVFVYQHHRVSGTSYQVKNRPCSIINHTYFLVFRKEN